MQRLRFVGHCWRSTYELVIDLILWQPHHGKRKCGRPAKQTSINKDYTNLTIIDDMKTAMEDIEGWKKITSWITEQDRPGKISIYISSKCIR